MALGPCHASDAAIHHRIACTRRVLLKSMSEKSMQVLGNMAFGSV
jgi:hypothetical protein